MIKEKLTTPLIIGFFFIGISVYGIISIYWPVITGELESLTYQYLFLFLPIAGLVIGSIIILNGLYNALESYLSRGIMVTILGSIILIPVIFFAINNILTILTGPSNPLISNYFLYQILLSVTPFLVPFSVSLTLLIIGIYTIVKKRKQRPAEKDQRDIKSPINNIYK